MSGNVILDKLSTNANDNILKNKIAFSLLTTNETITYCELYEKVLLYTSKLRDAKLVNIPVVILARLDINTIALILACINLHCIPIIKNIDNHMEKSMFKLECFFQTNDFVNTIISTFEFENLNSNFFQRYNILNIENSNKQNTDFKYNCYIENKNDLMFQETSGTTGINKLVLLSNNQIKNSLEFLDKCLPQNQDFINLSYLPFSHILGVITTIFLTIYKSGTTYIINPSEFKNNPNYWLNLLTQKQVSFIAGTNYSLQNVVDKMGKGNYDLSNLKTIYIGGESVKYSTIIQFYEKLKEYQLDLQSFVPSYGMTEMCGPICHDDSRENLSAYHKCDLVSCGTPNTNYVNICLKKDNGEIVEKQNGVFGEILIYSENLFKEYYNVKENIEWIYFNDKKYFNTNDYGIFIEGKLYVIGRNKSLIVKDGKKYSISELALCLRLLEKSYELLQFSAINIENKVILFQELKKHCYDKAYLKKIHNDIVELVKAKMNLELDEIIFLESDMLPKTDIGKIQTNEIKKMYLEGGYNAFVKKM